MIVRANIAAVLILACSPAHSVQTDQECTNEKHIACIQENGSNWGCDKDGFDGDCCKGRCSDNECTDWVCNPISHVTEPTVNWSERFEKAYLDFRKSFSSVSGNGLAFPSYVADQAWVDLSREFSMYVKLGEADGPSKAEIVRVVLGDPRGRLGGSNAESESSLCGKRFIELKRKAPTLPAVLESVTDIEVDHACIVIKEDIFSQGIYGWSTNGDNPRMRPKGTKPRT
mmetsp:Transcript_25395/g.51922  ORF Transcript_25395/g.51922 Transcript_25395/m.51922 type:complete len:228 (+) Transcript_25395:724-1407(+)